MYIDPIIAGIITHTAACLLGVVIGVGGVTLMGIGMASKKRQTWVEMVKQRRAEMKEVLRD